ncbi:unnamed protein product [Brassicogethes aeneus]|uniref:Uncharacterized protein n=1 Tax=Brassicogethes aeneus TaxID=1431903 RepID=A0A9P0F9L3_BRAAE|nr:unnamed protein product [Brassicogethes aeneus]
MQTDISEQQIPRDDLTSLVNSILDCCETQPLPNTTNTEICKAQTISSLLKHLQQNINTHKTSQFNVYREDIFGCCVQAMRRAGFDPFNKISVKFSDAEGTSEGAVDEGGPCREMFRLSLNWLKDSGMFCGAHKKSLNLCGNALHKNMYFEAGRLIVLSLIHGGPGPHFFSETLFTLLCGQIAVPTLDDIDRDTRDSDVFSLAGFPVIVKAEEQEKIVQGVLRFFAVDRIREPLGQLIEGLKTCGLYEKLKQYPSIFKDIFCSEITLSSKILEELFLIVYTEPGTNTRSKENRVISYFRDYVLDLECM